MAAKMFEEDTLTQREYFAVMSKEGKRDFIFGGCCYDVETGDGKRVFTLRAARKCSLEEIDAIMHYMTVADKVDVLNNEKDAISFNNLYKAMKEKMPPPTEEEIAETENALKEFKQKHADLFKGKEEGE
jgi:hypothetical protein